MDVIAIIRKLAIHDTWNQLVVHVAMDMLVVMDDMGKNSIASFIHIM